MHAEDVELVPRAERAALRVEYSPDLVPELRTVRQPDGGLVREALLTSSTGALMQHLRNKLRSNESKVKRNILALLSLGPVQLHCEGTGASIVYSITMATTFRI